MYYPLQDEAKTYSFEISRVFGFLSILFAIYIPLTGLMMGGLGLYYEQKDAKENDSQYNRLNLTLNAIGIMIGGMYLAYWMIFKLRLLG
jgi:hypothetical protein